MQQVARACAAAHVRQLVVLAGEQQWGHQQASAAMQLLPGEWCWVGDRAATSNVKLVTAQSAHTLLGGEWHGVVYDARAGFDANAFGAVAGSVGAGGLLLLLTPSLAEWPDYPDPQRSRITFFPYDEEAVARRFLSRLARLLQHSSQCLLIEQHQPLPALPQYSLPPSSTEDFDECATADQLTAVETLCKVAQGHRRRPLVLVSDRGRGKSAALGLAAARLLRQGLRSIVVTAPRLAAVASLFQHAQSRLPGAEVGRGVIKTANGAVVRFMPPDQLLHAPAPCELLLVDEAAAIPTALLERMLRHHSRIAFATTVHGYEGTGRGFDLRFRKVLDEQTPEWRRLQMQQPIRWADGDPLEHLVFRALLLDAEPAADKEVEDLPLDACTVEWLERDALAEDEGLLSQLFGLLVLAHYRTAPSDLRNLLDGPNLEIVVLRHQQQVLACALVANEGGLDEELSQQVYLGRRRLRGNLLPQSLSVHAGIASAATLQAARVMRIAVHPAIQRKGLGSKLVDAVMARAKEQGMDYMGASFGASPELLDFWSRQGCLPVRIGLKREASSGTHAAMVMRPTSPAGEKLFAEARQRLSTQLPLLLSEPLCELEAELVERLLQAQGGGALPDESLWSDITSFALGNRDYGNSMSALHALTIVALSDSNVAEVLSPAQRSLIIDKVLQRRPWGELVQQHGLNGRSEAQQQLRRVFVTLCEHFGKS